MNEHDDPLVGLFSSLLIFTATALRSSCVFVSPPVVIKSVMMLSTKILRLSRCVAPINPLQTLAAGTRAIHSTVKVAKSSDEDKDILHTVSDLRHLRLEHSVEPIPYTAGIELTPENVSADKLGHKKVTVVGCGQVGMAIAYSMLNQVTAGTIALVDMNKAKLEGEAKDLQQGSAFHQHVRILASDEYVSIWQPETFAVASPFLMVHFFFHGSRFPRIRTW